MARIGVVVFPGSNCEYDAAAAVTRLGDQAEFIWHTRTDLEGIDGIILPGGFAHGDYLRPGALARFSPVMGAVERFAADGGPVLGICNGFQVLVEAGMLPGALQKNRGLTFLCQPTTVVVTSTNSVLTRAAPTGKNLVVRINLFWALTRVTTIPTTRSCATARSCSATKRIPMVRVMTLREWPTKRATWWV